MSENARHRLGALGEQVAADHLIRRGFEIVERNYRTRWGELDIVAYDGRTLAFCEVKARTVGGRTGTALEAVSTFKRRQVRRMAGSWLRERAEHPRAAAIRCDAIGVSFDGRGQLVAIDHVEGAF